MTRVFADEGGYTNDPVDPGGATNWGITIIDARKYWKADASPSDVKNMPKSAAADIYRKHYANPMRYDELPAGFDYSVLDAAINSGVGRAPVWAGKALGVTAKSINDVIGPANAAPDKVAAIQKYWAVRLAFLKGLSTFWRFGKGWTRRVTTGEAAAVKMWLTVGAVLSTADTKKRMDAEAGKAKTQASTANKAATASGTAGAGSAASPAVPVDGFVMSFEVKVLVFALAAIAIMLAIYFIKQALIHKQRAEAYAAA
ncbi:glycosyl hydrolase 108 family protein [Bradyrhizobium sp. LA6.8]|uniref:glycoside hydrolase family 108 protein n=1 Tax=unclassified Bradyrhizobium TaxID=2631580 RepID=UPI00339513AA